MPQSTALLLVESRENVAVVEDPENAEWLALLGAANDEHLDLSTRRYHLALSCFRARRSRRAIPGRPEVAGKGKQKALQGMLELIEQRKASGMKTSEEVFVDAHPQHESKDTPASLRDFSIAPPSLREILGGRGRPPIDGACLCRAFLAAPLLGVGDSPTAVFRLLHSNPHFAHQCGFVGRSARTGMLELTSRKLPSLAVCEEFDEVMTQYGLWNCGRIEQVRENFRTGAVKIEDTMSFDTTHLEANSHCDSVEPETLAAAQPVEEDGKKPKQRKVPRMRKHCMCGKNNWESCEHPWSPTDWGAAIVVKGATRIYWAHKFAVVAFGDSEIPIDARACTYAAVNDGKTLPPHLEILQREMPEAVRQLRHALADTAYRDNYETVARYGQNAQLHVPVQGKKTPAAVAKDFVGIARFTPTGVPVCDGGHRFDMRGRDVTKDRYIWSAPDDENGKSVCKSCPLRASCLKKGSRRNIRVERSDFPQIYWEHPQHLGLQRKRYGKRTGVERAIKLLKVDFAGEKLTHRDALRVQAHIDKRLLAIHLLLAADS